MTVWETSKQTFKRWIWDHKNVQFQLTTVGYFQILAVKYGFSCLWQNKGRWSGKCGKVLSSRWFKFLPVNSWYRSHRPAFNTFWYSHKCLQFGFKISQWQTLSGTGLKRDRPVYLNLFWVVPKCNLIWDSPCSFYP